MEGDDLICNFKKCRKPLTAFAYVTACSHVFCDEDGTREFNKATTCPACQTNLSGKFEIVRNNLQPSEQYKSMILAGLKPDCVSEICSRALSFWVYQSHQEKTYQEYMATKAKDHAIQLEQYYEQMLSRTQTELSTAKKDQDETKKKYNEISDKLMERNRQHQKLQSMYDCMRRKFITMSSFEKNKSTPTQLKVPNHCTSGDSLLKEFVPGSGRGSRSSSPNRFDFNPAHDLDQPANYIQRKFSVGLGTPRS